MSAPSTHDLVQDLHLSAMHHGQASYPRQVWVLVRRNLTHIKRMPEMLLDVTIQPVMFVMLFAYVFGGSIQTGTAGGYREWLLPGIMAQTMAFASFIVAVGLTADIDSGIGVIVMSLTGLLVGWRIHNGLPKAVLAYGLLLLFGFAMIWVGILVGSALTSVEAVQGVMFTAIFPLTFMANTFAPTEGMPSVVRHIAEWNPISALVQAMRELWGNAAPLGADAALPLQHPVLASTLWSIGISLVLGPLAVRAFLRRTT